MNILLCITGSVAAMVSHKVVHALSKEGNVRNAVTHTAWKHFGDSFNFDGYGDTYEWDLWQKDGATLHIELKDWADVIVFAPLSANTLAKMVYGMCDNLVTSIFRGWPVGKPIVLAPAMNTDMWKNPVTAEHLTILQKRYGYYDGMPGVNQKKMTVVSPVEKTLVCGTTGIGAMAHADDIAKAVRESK